MSQKFEEFQSNLSLRALSSVDPWTRDPVIRLPDPSPAVNIVDANLDYDSDEEMRSQPDSDEYFDVDIGVQSGVDPMEVELEDIRMKAVEAHYTKPSTWNPASLLDRLFCCSAITSVHVV